MTASHAQPLTSAPGTTFRLLNLPPVGSDIVKIVGECACDRTPEHVWLATLETFALGVRCPICPRKSLGKVTLDVTDPELSKQLVSPAEATEVTRGSDRKLLWRCSANRDHSDWWARVSGRVGCNTRLPKGCPECQKMSKAELAVLDGLRECAPPGTSVLARTFPVVNADGKSLQLDFYVPEFRFAIEVNGSQHYRPVTWGSRTQDEAEERFIVQKTYDRQRQEWCDAHDVKLVVIHAPDRRPLAEMKAEAGTALIDRMRTLLR
jgi:Probable Zinc-ribbon domain